MAEREEKAGNHEETKDTKRAASTLGIAIRAKAVTWTRLGSTISCSMKDLEAAE